MFKAVKLHTPRKGQKPAVITREANANEDNTTCAFVYMKKLWMQLGELNLQLDRYTLSVPVYLLHEEKSYIVCRKKLSDAAPQIPMTMTGQILYLMHMKILTDLKTNEGQKYTNAH